jgi:hypothetical protein
MPFDAAPSLFRTFDVERLNALANHPEIRPTCGGDGKSFIDLTPFVNDRHNHALLWSNGYFLYLWTAPQTFEVHAVVLKEGRGLPAYRAASHSIEYMVAHGAERLWARIDPTHRALRHFAASNGFERCGQHVTDIGFGPVIYDLYQWKKPCQPH